MAHPPGGRAFDCLFRDEAIIRRLVVDNKSACLILPTGGGKSLTYQLPSVIFDGLTLVVSPLLALTKVSGIGRIPTDNQDQVDVLKRKGVRAAALDSSNTWEEAAE